MPRKPPFSRKKISQQLNKLNCKFLWGDTVNHKRCHTVSWETITTPKDAGGLGLARHMNVYFSYESGLEASTKFIHAMGSSLKSQILSPYKSV